MMKLRKFLAGTLAALTLLALLPMAAWASETPTYRNIKDASATYPAFIQSFGKSIPLDGAAETVFEYTVPQDGVTVLLFFRANGACENTNAFVAELTNTAWARDSKVNIVAVESTAADQSTVQTFLDTYDTNHVIDQVWYNPKSNAVAFWYAKLVENNGDMAGVTSLYGASVSFAHVLLITKGADGNNYIRFNLPGVDTVAYLSGYINEVLGTGGEGTGDSKVTVTVPGSKRYDYVADILASVNANRAEAGAAALTLSGALTELAMQRAAECALYYGHTRPNREGPFTVSDGVHTYSGTMMAENIAAGQSAPAEVMRDWMNSQGHREAILSAAHTQLGVGCFENNGTLYWVQLFGKGSDASQPTSADSTPADVPVETYTSRLEPTLSSAGELSISGAGQAQAPKLYTTNQGNGFGRRTILLPPTQSVADAAGKEIARVTATVGTGTLTVTGTAVGQGTLSLPAYEGQQDALGVSLRVTGTALTRSMFTVDTTAETYDGTAKTKEVTSALTPDSDYAVSYSNNLKAGTATLTISGRGLYSGEIVYSFSINKAQRALAAAGDAGVLYLGGDGARITVTDNAAEDGPTYTYRSDDTRTLTVDNRGVVTPVAAGTATVTVTAAATDNYLAGSAQVAFTVTEAATLEDGALNGGDIQVRYHVNTIGAVTLIDAVPDSDMVFAAYWKGDAFLGAKAAPQDAATKALSGWDTIKLFWIGSQDAPQCPAKTVRAK